MSELEEYKKNQANILLQRYNSSIKLLNLGYYNSVRNINSGNIPRSRKISLLKRLLDNHTNNKQKLLDDYNYKLNITMNLTSIPNSTTSTTSTTVPVPTQTVPVPVPTPTVPVPVSLPTVSNKKKALVIGINYIGTKYRLSGCINDAYTMDNILRTKYGFSDIQILTDNTPIKPTAYNISTAIISLLKSGENGDLLFISYSGHGSYTNAIGSDEQDGRDELLVGSDIMPVKDNELRNIINKYLKKGVTLVMLSDSCYSQTVLDLKYQYLDTYTNKELNVNTVLIDTEGTVILFSASQDNQQATETFSNGLMMGALTATLLQTLNINSRPTWRSLLLNIRTLGKKYGYSQIAQLSSGKPLDIDTVICL
jgi:hypothetical protein